MDQTDRVMRLTLIAAKAAQLAADLRDGRLWPGEFNQGIAEIRDQLEKINLDKGPAL